MREYFTTKQAAELVGVSRSAMRVYTSEYARHLSTEATPEPGQARRFTQADLHVLAFVSSRTSAGATHDQVAEELAAGALEQFDWQPLEPEEPQAGAEGSESATGGALVPIAQLQAAQLLLGEAQRREREALEREQAAQERLRELEHQLGKAEGELAGYKAAQRKAPGWWVRLFGGRSE